MTSERTTVNLRGYCLYCLDKLGDSDFSASPACSPLKSPLEKRHLNLHTMTVEERLAPFTVLCRYLGIDLPDCYAFGDETVTSTLTLTPPLCKRCHEMSARLCFLQDELQHIQAKITNVTERIYRRVANTCDQHGALKREAFQKEFKSKCKSSLSRGRGENLKTKRATQLVKAFQIKIIEKEHQIMQTKNGEISLTSVNQHNPCVPMELELENVCDFPPLEILRSKPICDENLYFMECQKEIPENICKDYSELTTILYPHNVPENTTRNDAHAINSVSKRKKFPFSPAISNFDDICPVVTRSQAKILQRKKETLSQPYCKLRSDYLYRKTSTRKSTFVQEMYYQLISSVNRSFSSVHTNILVKMKISVAIVEKGYRNLHSTSVSQGKDSDDIVKTLTILV